MKNVCTWASFTVAKATFNAWYQFQHSVTYVLPHYILDPSPNSI